MNPLRAIKRIWEGGETEKETGAPGEISDTIKFVLKELEEAKRYREDKVASKWPTFDKYYVGRQWDARQTRSRIVRLTFNHIHGIIEEKIGLFTANKPRIFVEPRNADSEADQVKATLGEQMVDAIWDEQDILQKTQKALEFGGVRGRPSMKTALAWDLEHPTGYIRVDPVNPSYLYVDPWATNDQDSGFTIYCRPVSLDYLKGAYGSRAYGIRANVFYDEPDKEDDQANNSGSYQINSPVGQTGDTSRKLSGAMPRVYLVECWQRDSQVVEKEIEIAPGVKTTMLVPLYPHGRLKVFAGDVVLRDDRNPYPWFPFDGFPWYSRLTSYWGISEVELLKDPQDEFNAKLSGFLQQIRMRANGKWLADKRAGINTKNISTDPGELITINNGGKLERFPVSDLSAVELQAIAATKSEMRSLAGLEDMVGSKGKTHVAGKTVENQQAAQHVRILRQVFNYERMLEGVARKIFWLAKTFYSQERTFKVQDRTTGETKLIRLNPAQDLTGDYDMRVGVGSTLPISKTANFSRDLALYGLKLIDQKAVLDGQDYPNRVQIMERMKAAQGGQPGEPATPGKGAPPKQGTSKLAAKALDKIA